MGASTALGVWGHISTVILMVQCLLSLNVALLTPGLWRNTHTSTEPRLCFAQALPHLPARTFCCWLHLPSQPSLLSPGHPDKSLPRTAGGEKPGVPDSLLGYAGNQTLTGLGFFFASSFPFSPLFSCRGQKAPPALSMSPHQTLPGTHQTGVFQSTGLLLQPSWVWVSGSFVGFFFLLSFYFPLRPLTLPEPKHNGQIITLL